MVGDDQEIIRALQTRTHATNGELRLENKNGNKITDIDYDNTAYVEGQLHFIF